MIKRTNIFYIIIILFISSYNAIAQTKPPVAFLPGDDHYMLDYPVNVRSEPNLKGNVIGQLALHERIKIIERMDNYQEINNILAYWYKIAYKGSFGYIWGGYIACISLIFDIDGNGVNDFFYFRVSNISSDGLRDMFVIDSWNDVFIYINNKKISTHDLQLNNNHKWRWCYFVKSNNKVTIELVSDIRSGPNVLEYIDVFEIDKNGKIEFIKSIERFN
jgi:hypothetical protein